MLLNMEAEQSVLGAILLEGSLIKECLLQSSHFGVENHSIIFDAMRQAEQDGKPVDLVTVTEHLARLGDDLTGAISYMSQLAGSVPTVANFKFYENIVIETWKARQASEIARSVIESAEVEKGSEVINDALNRLTKIEEFGYADEYNHKETLLELYDDIENQPDGLTGMDTGYPDLNVFLNGLQEEDLVIVGARPSLGKTAFALNVGANAARPKPNQEGDVVAIFSLEMPKKQLLRRMLCAEGNIDATKMRNPKKFFDQSDWEKVTHALGRINEMNLHIYDDSSVTVQEIRAKVRALRKRFPKKRILVIIDYLQLIQGSAQTKSYNRTQEIGDISRALKLMSRELKVTTVALSQLSRSVEQRQDKRPMMSDLRESGNIEQDADVIMFLYRDDYYDRETENKNVCEVIVAKQRNGATGVVELAFLREYNKFVSLDHRFRGQAS